MVAGHGGSAWFPSRRTLRSVSRWWGVVPLFLLAVGVRTLYSGVVPYIGLSLLVLSWALFGAPAVCCAINRLTSGTGEPLYCRNNASGLLLGCNQVRAHKWQKLHGLWWTAILRRQGWRDLWGSPTNWIATISGLLGILLPAATAVLYLLR